MNFVRLKILRCWVRKNRPSQKASSDSCG